MSCRNRSQWRSQVVPLVQDFPTFSQLLQRRQRTRNVRRDRRQDSSGGQCDLVALGPPDNLLLLSPCRRNPTVGSPCQILQWQAGLTKLGGTGQCRRSLDETASPLQSLEVSKLWLFRRLQRQQASPHPPCVIGRKLSEKYKKTETHKKEKQRKRDL